MNQLKQKYAALNSKSRQALWIALSMALALFISGLFTFHNFFIGKSFFEFEVLANFISWILGLIAIAAAWLIINGRSSMGGYVFVAGVSLGFLLVTGITSGLGFLFAGITFVLITYFASRLMTERVAGWSPVLGLLVAIAILLLDTFCPWRRIATTGADLYQSYILGVVLGIAYLGFVIRQFANFPLRTKLVNSLLAAVILPVALIGGITNNMTQRALSTEAARSLQISADQVAANLDAFIWNNMDQIRAEAQSGDFVEFLEMDPEMREGSEASQHVETLLNAFMKKDAVFISSYGLLDRNGISVADTNQADVGLDKSDRGYFREAIRTGLPYVSPLFISKVIFDPVIFFSAPIRNSTGDIIGVLRVRYNALVLQQQIVHKGDLGASNAFAILVDDHNILLADSQDTAFVFKSIVPLSDGQITELQAQGLLPNLPAEQLVQDMPVLAEGIRNAASHASFSGDFHVNSADLIPDSPTHREEAVVVNMSAAPWRIVLAVPQDILFAPLKQQTQSTVLIGIGISLLVALLAVLLAQYIANPVVSLTNVANKVAGGDLSARAMVKSGDEIGTLAGTFNAMAEQLSGLVDLLEQRVADRTRALETSAQVSRRISTILDANQLVLEVVEQVKLEFNYYHVHIYLFDAAREYLVMAGGSGEPGRMMLARGHKIAKGRGLVGRAAETGSPVLVEDVSQAPNWLPNPLLPHTKSEIAVPIAVGGNVLGVLDVQQDEVGALKQEDTDLLQSIANQIAVALQNTRIYAQVQHQASREALIAAIGQRIQRTTTTDEALKIAVREVGRAIGVQRTTVQLDTKSENGDKKSNPS